eukprot:gene35889-44253_t
MCGIYALLVGFYLWRYYIATTVMERLRANKAIDPLNVSSRQKGKKGAINRQQSMYAAASFWNMQNHSDSVMMFEESHAEQDERLISKLPGAVIKMAKLKDGWGDLNAASLIVKKENFFTNTLTRKLLAYDVKQVVDVETMAIIQSQTKEKYRKALVRPLLYRDKHQSSSDPRLALTRMLQKYVGKTHELRGYTLNEEELEEVMEMYFSWVLERDLDGTMVPFGMYESWFLLLSARI